MAYGPASILPVIFSLFQEAKQKHCYKTMHDGWIIVRFFSEVDHCAFLFRGEKLFIIIRWQFDFDDIASIRVTMIMCYGKWAVVHVIDFVPTTSKILS